MELYIEGVKINCLPNSGDWQKADAVTLPCAARVIAVKGVDYGVIAGILASTDDGSILTDSSWKCTNQHYAGWETVGFDDSDWPAAHQVAIHQTLPWKLVPGIRTNAFWIWTRHYVNGDWTVYCRKDLIKVRANQLSWQVRHKTTPAFGLIDHNYYLMTASTESKFNQCCN